VRILKVQWTPSIEYIVHRNPCPPQLEYTSSHSWAGLSIGQRYSTPFAASTSTGLSKYTQPAQAEDGMGPVSSYTRSLILTNPIPGSNIKLCSPTAGDEYDYQVTCRKEGFSLCSGGGQRLRPLTSKELLNPKHDGHIPLPPLSAPILGGEGGTHQRVGG
jgi:hypothetical protein